MLIWQNVKNKTCQFHDKEFVVSKDYEQELREKVAIFREQTRTRKSIFVTMLLSEMSNKKTDFALNIISLS
jgi:uncharacterized protein